MKVYLASRFSRLPELLGYKAELEAEGIAVTSRWLLGGHEWVGTPDEETPIEFQAECARIDLEDIRVADAIVCFTEPARSGPARGGRHVEMGCVLGINAILPFTPYYDGPIRILVVAHRENVFCCLDDELTFAPDWDTAKAWLLKWREEVDNGHA